MPGKKPASAMPSSTPPVSCGSRPSRHPAATESTAHTDATATSGPAAPEAAGGASNNPEARAIEASSFSGTKGSTAKRRLLIKVETLLDREHFSPGEIDGQNGSNLENAIAAFEQVHGLSGGGKLDAALVEDLTKADAGPVTRDYVITAEDEEGPFLGTIPSGFPEMAKLKSLGYANPLQDFADEGRVGFALRELHHLAFERVERGNFARLVICHWIGILGDRLVT